MTTESKPKKRPASKASASKKEAETTNSRQEKAVKALRVAKDRVEKAAMDAKKKVKAVKEQIDTEENRTKVKAAVRLSRMKAGKAKDKAESLLEKAKAKAEEVAEQMEMAAVGHPKAELVLKQARKAKAKVDAASERLKTVRETVSEQGKKARKVTTEAVGKTKAKMEEAVKAARKFKDTVDTPANRAKVKDAACSIGNSLKEAVGDMIKERSESKGASKSKPKATKPAKDKVAKATAKPVAAKTGPKETKASASEAKPRKTAAKAAAKAGTAKSAKGGRADEDATELTAKELGIPSEEYGQICRLLGRTPNFVELRLYAWMWREDVSYKNSIAWLRTLPLEDGCLPSGTGNAQVDLHDRQACVLAVDAGPSEEAVADRLSWLNGSAMARGGRPAVVAAYRMSGMESGQGLKEFTASEDVFSSEGKDVVVSDLMSVNFLPKDLQVPKESAGKGDLFYLVEAEKNITPGHLWQAISALLADKAVLALVHVGRSGLAGAFSRLCGMTGMGVRIEFPHDPVLLKAGKSEALLLSQRPNSYLLVVRKGGEGRLFNHLPMTKWAVAEVMEGDRMQCFEQGHLLVDIPVSSLMAGKGAPVYDRRYKEAKNFAQCRRFDIHTVKDIDLEEAVSVAHFLSARLKFPDCLSVEARLGENVQGKDVVVTMAGNAAYVFANPLVGAQIAVAEAARNLVCSGAQPLGMAPCFNFGNPQNPEAYWQFVNAVKGVGAAFEKLRVPMTGTDARFSETKVEDAGTGVSNPAVVVGMVGLREGRGRVGRGFTRKGHAIYLLGKSMEDINSSRYLAAYRKQAYSPAPYFDLEEEYKLQRVIMDAMDSHLLESICPVSEGGLFMALLESAKEGNLGFDIMVDDTFRLDSYLFGESQSRVVVSVDEAVDVEFKDLMMETGTPMVCLGEVTGGKILVDDYDFGKIEDYKH